MDVEPSADRAPIWEAVSSGLPQGQTVRAWLADVELSADHTDRWDSVHRKLLVEQFGRPFP